MTLAQRLWRIAILPMLLALVSAIAMLAIIGVVIGAMAQQHHHPLHQDFYMNWKQPGTNTSCCNARISHPNGMETGDCEPTRAEIRAGDWWVWIPMIQEWRQVPDAKILREPNPNIFDAHVCFTRASGILCFVPPSTGG